jgi:hypothetical protein
LTPFQPLINYEQVNGPWDDPREAETKMLEKMLAVRRLWIAQKARVLIEACSIMADRDTGTSKPKPHRPDIAYAISLLLEAMPETSGPGRPRAPKVNGVMLRTLRIEAGMTQANLVDAVRMAFRSIPGYAGAFNVKSLRRYESSEGADQSYLVVIAEILTACLSRAITVGQLTFA